MCEKLERVFFVGSQASVWGSGNLLVKGIQSPGTPAVDSDESAFAVAAQTELKIQPHTVEARVCPSHLPGSRVSAEIPGRGGGEAWSGEGRRRGERWVRPQGNSRTRAVLETAPAAGQGWARLSHPTPTSHGAGLAPGRMGIEADRLMALAHPKHWVRAT